MIKWTQVTLNREQMKVQNWRSSTTILSTRSDWCLLPKKHLIDTPLNTYRQYTPTSRHAHFLVVDRRLPKAKVRIKDLFRQEVISFLAKTASIVSTRNKTDCSKIESSRDTRRKRSSSSNDGYSKQQRRLADVDLSPPTHKTK